MTFYKIKLCVLILIHRPVTVKLMNLMRGDIGLSTQGAGRPQHPHKKERFSFLGGCWPASTNQTVKKNTTEVVSSWILVLFMFARVKLYYLYELFPMRVCFFVSAPPDERRPDRLSHMSHRLMMGINMSPSNKTSPELKEFHLKATRISHSNTSI